MEHWAGFWCRVACGGGRWRGRRRTESASTATPRRRHSGTSEWLSGGGGEVREDMAGG